MFIVYFTLKANGEEYQQNFNSELDAKEFLDYVKNSELLTNVRTEDIE